MEAGATCRSEQGAGWNRVIVRLILRNEINWGMVLIGTAVTVAFFVYEGAVYLNDEEKYVHVDIRDAEKVALWAYKDGAPVAFFEVA